MIVAVLTFTAASFLVDIGVEHILVLIPSLFLVGFFFAQLGVLVGVRAEQFDDVSFAQTFVLQPLIFLGGVFYSASLLDEPFQTLTHFNPIYYMINLVRYGFLGYTEANVALSLGILTLATGPVRSEPAPLHAPATSCALTDFLVKRDDIRDTRIAESEPPELEPGQALLRVHSFGLTANNVTYAVMGDLMNYWAFFPAEEGWGRVPMWGFADVEQSEAEGLEAGARVYGYLPPSSHLVVTPTVADENGFVDGSPHRLALPATYQRYTLTGADPFYRADTEDIQMLLRPLFFTSFLIDDQLDDEGLDRAGAGGHLERLEQDRHRRGISCWRSARASSWWGSPRRAARSSSRASGSTTARSRTTRSARSSAAPPRSWTSPATATCASPCTPISATTWPTRMTVGVTHWEEIGAGGGVRAAGPPTHDLLRPGPGGKRSQDWGAAALQPAWPTRGTGSASGRAAGSRWSAGRGSRASRARTSTCSRGASTPRRRTCCRSAKSPRRSTRRRSTAAPSGRRRGRR